MKKEIIEIKQVSWFDDRFYKIKYTKDNQEIEEYLPSTTTKLGALAKPFLIRWYGQLGTREAELRRNEAADKGTRQHLAWHALTTGGAIVYQPFNEPLYSKDEIEKIYKTYKEVIVITNQDEMFNMTKLQKFLEIVKPKIVASEVIVYDLENKEAGTADNIFDIEKGAYKINGSIPLKLPKGRYIFDLKTGKSIGKEANMQVADYSKMAGKAGFGEIIGTLIGHTQAKTKSGIEGFSVSYQDKEKVSQEYQDFRDIARVWERNFAERKPVVRELPGLITLEEPIISETEQHSLVKGLKQFGVSSDIFTDFLDVNYQITKLSDIKKRNFDEICKWIAETNKKGEVSNEGNS